MIVTFSIENFRSFKEEETFSLVSSNRFSGSHKNHLVPIPKSESKVLRAGVIYGANGAGKSNFFKALAYLRSMAIKGRAKGKGTGREAFRLGDGAQTSSSFDLQFIVKEKLFRFGLILDDDRIIEEWLLVVEGNREKPVYERTTDPSGNVSIIAKGLEKTDKKLAALVTVGGTKEQSFLATVRATLEKEDYGEIIGEVIQWFEHGLTFIGPDSTFLPLGHILSSDSNFQTFASEFLRSSSTGVDDIDVAKKSISEDQLKVMLPAKLFSKVTADASQGSPVIVKLDEGREVLIEKTRENQYYLLTIQSVHRRERDSPVNFDFSEESDGTRRLLNLLPALHRLHTEGGVFIIDEVERSMHPLLIFKFMQFFLSGCGGKRRQLIVTTHDSNLLDQDLLRRDEIWFAEKNAQGATKLYPLSDFQPRNDLKLDKHYLQGRFGAVPFLGDMDLLMEKEAPPE